MEGVDEEFALTVAPETDRKVTRVSLSSSENVSPENSGGFGLT
ncbi:hypothetical protein A2U01_0064467 [Trifolium medium]|uniref:Uncharacterized protein n=1 Tax=Trifolium medium TaxID=97028 RepID=A0A392S5E8_9FABA|nr:hypothetical protein [Trifolium medium]